MNKLSIITPTYNRGKFLNEIYEALSKYQLYPFEWIIIDDGSTDNTVDLVNGFAAIFEIRYIYQANSGKHVAVNKGVELAKYQYTVILDSDDIPLPNAVNIIIEKLNNTPSEIVGIGVNMCDSSGNIIGKYQNSVFSDTIENAYLKGLVSGDKWFIWKTDFIKRFKFPVYDNEFFVPEGLIYNRISRLGFKLEFYPLMLLNARYQSDGYSKNIRALKYENFNAFLLYYCEKLISNNFSFDKASIKSYISLQMLILNRVKYPYLLLLYSIVSIPFLLFTLLFFDFFYTKNRRK